MIMQFFLNSRFELFQFEEGILTASIYCLARAFNFRYGRALADPVRVSRALSKIVSIDSVL